MSEIPFKKMNAFFAQIDIGLIKSFFFNLLNFLDIIVMLSYDEIDSYGSPRHSPTKNPPIVLLIINLVTKKSLCIVSKVQREQ
jgi:hypothetical protein